MSSFLFFAEGEEEDDYKTQVRTPQRNTKASRLSSGRKQKGSSNKRVPTRKADIDGDDEVEDEDEEAEDFGQWFHYKDGEEGYADKVVHVRSKRGQGHLNDPVDLIAKLDKGVRMKYEGGT